MRNIGLLLWDNIGRDEVELYEFNRAISGNVTLHFWILLLNSEISRKDLVD